jgi:hypothetical protein
MLQLLIAAMFAAIAAPAQTPAGAERRCGWIANPTPGNWWMTDRQGEWILSTQGDYLAPGMDRIPDMTERGWVRTNGDYGYGCACMTVRTDRRTMRVTRLYSLTPVPLRQCRADPRLRRPS